MAVCALIVASTAAFAQQSSTPKELFERVVAISKGFDALQSSERATAIEELRRIESELDAQVAALGSLETPKGLAAAMYRVAYERTQRDAGEDRQARLALLEKAARFATLAGKAENAANLRLSANNEALAAGDDEIARKTAEEVLAGLAPGSELRLFALQQLASAHLLGGRYADALGTLDELERAAGAAAPGVFAIEPALGLRSQIYLELGLGDVAAPCVAAEVTHASALRQAAESGASAGDWHDAWFSARLHQANLELLNDNHAGVVELVDLELRERSNWQRNPVALAQLEIIQARALANLERNDATRPGRAREILMRVYETLDVGPARRRTAALRLAELAIRASDVASAEVLLARVASELGAWKEGEGSSEPVREEVELATLQARLALARPAPRASRALDSSAPLDPHGPEWIEALKSPRNALEIAYAKFLRRWRDAPLRPGGLGYLQHGARRAVLSELFRLHAAIDGTSDGAELAVRDLLRAEALGTVARNAGGVEATLERVRAELLDDTGGLLVLLTGPDQSHWLAFRRDDALIVQAPREDVLRAACRDYTARLDAFPASGSREERDAYARGERKLAREFANTLIPYEIEEFIAPWRSLTLVGVEPFGDVPFECLPLAKQTYIGTVCAVDRLPSMTFGLWLARRPRDAATSDYVVFTHPTPSPFVREHWPQLSELPNASAMQAVLQANFTAARNFSAELATRDALAQADLQHVRVLQFITHGVQDSRRERRACLVLHGSGDDEGLLDCDAVEKLRAPRVVELSTCRAAQGPTRVGDASLSSLGGAWLAAGAQGVVLSSADLVWEPTMRISAAFHAHLARGETLGEALRAARAQLASDAEYSSPSFHGRIELLGLGRVRVFVAGGGSAAPGPPVAPLDASELQSPSEEPETSDLRWLYAVGALIVVVAALAGLRRRG